MPLLLDGIPLSVQRRFPELENRHVDFLKRDITKAMNKAAALDELIPGLLSEYRTVRLTGCGILSAPGFAHCSGRSHRPPLNGRMLVYLPKKIRIQEGRWETLHSGPS
ncbi:terminase small subunit [Escherichia coli]